MIVSHRVIEYIEKLIPDREPLLIEMEAFATEHRVPIMDLVGIEAMLQLLNLMQPKRILEIGTAIGYSSIRMAKRLPHTKIITIELNEERYEQALNYIRKANLADQIEVILGDALLLDNRVKERGPFDCLFIDAAKGKYKRFFELYSMLLTDHGAIISDNILFKGMVAEETVENRRIRSMVNKIKDYNEWLMGHSDFSTTIFPVGDGIAVSKKR